MNEKATSSNGATCWRMCYLHAPVSVPTHEVLAIGRVLDTCDVVLVSGQCHHLVDHDTLVDRRTERCSRPQQDTSDQLRCANKECISMILVPATIVKKGRVLYSAVSSLLDRSKCFTRFIPRWQTCSFRHQLGFSGKHSSQAAIMRKD